jgi:hypothetical protein
MNNYKTEEKKSKPETKENVSSIDKIQNKDEKNSIPQKKEHTENPFMYWDLSGGLLGI